MSENMQAPQNPNFKAGAPNPIKPIPLGLDTQTQRGQNSHQLPREARAFRSWNNTLQLLNFHAETSGQPFEQGLATDILHIREMIEKDKSTTKLYLHETGENWEFGHYTKVFIVEGDLRYPSNGT